MKVGSAVLIILAGVVISGCATKPLEPSESLMVNADGSYTAKSFSYKANGADTLTWLYRDYRKSCGKLNKSLVKISEKVVEKYAEGPTEPTRVEATFRCE